MYSKNIFFINKQKTSSRECKHFHARYKIFVIRLESLLVLSAVAVVSVVVGSSFAVVLCMAFGSIQSIRRTGKFQGPLAFLNTFKEPMF